ncbi:MAG: TRAP transporter small permease [Paracoccaceae bacterium]
MHAPSDGARDDGASRDGDPVGGAGTSRAGAGGTPGSTGGWPGALFDMVLDGAAGAAAIAFAGAGAMLGYEVGARYLFTAPTIWAAELAQLCLIWGCLMASPWCLREGRHITVTAGTAFLSGRARAAIDAVAMLLVAAFSAVVLWKGTEIFADSWTRGRTTGSMLDLPAWVAELAVPVGFLLLGLEALRLAAGAIRQLKTSPHA